MQFTFFKKKRSGGERDLDADRFAIRAYDACSRSYHDFRGGRPLGSALPNDIYFSDKKENANPIAKTEKKRARVRRVEARAGPHRPAQRPNEHLRVAFVGV